MPGLEACLRLRQRHALYFCPYGKLRSHHGHQSIEWHCNCTIVGMLRITIRQHEERVCVVLEGRLVGKWADELRRVILDTDLHSLPVDVDIKDVTSVDENGEEVLRWLSRIGARFQNGAASSKWLCERLGIPVGTARFGK